jgi:hypothetical protein
MIVRTSFLNLKPGRGAQAAPSRGRLVARLLAGAWRGSLSQPINSAQELEEVGTLLVTTGAGGLAWCRVRHSDLRSSSAARQLQQAYRFHSLQAAVHEHNLRKVIPLLRHFGVEPIVVKGWAIARHYLEPGMRPYCDLDMCVSPDQRAKAEAALKSPEVQGCDVDLHPGFGKFYDRQGDDLFMRSQLVRLNDLEVRVLSEEDHLRFLCVHLLRHGAVRPLWLCDIAVLLEARHPGFDWDQCLRHSRQQADWVACAVGLAHQLLGVEVEGTPIARRAKKLPKWLVPAVLEEWGEPCRSPEQVVAYLRNPLRGLRALLRELPNHWPNPIEATMTLKGSFNELPRLPFQVGHVFSRAAALLIKTPGLFEKARSS